MTKLLNLCKHMVSCFYLVVVFLCCSLAEGKMPRRHNYLFVPNLHVKWSVSLSLNHLAQSAFSLHNKTVLTNILCLKPDTFRMVSDCSSSKCYCKSTSCKAVSNQLRCFSHDQQPCVHGLCLHCSLHTNRQMAHGLQMAEIAQYKKRKAERQQQEQLAKKKN